MKAKMKAMRAICKDGTETRTSPSFSVREWGKCDISAQSRFDVPVPNAVQYNRTIGVKIVRTVAAGERFYPA